MTKVLTFAMVLASLAMARAASELRTFKDASGRELQAEVVSVGEEKVTLKRNDGKEFELEISKLSEPDQAFLGELREASGKAVAKLNEAAGHELFSKAPLMERPAEELAKKLWLPAESETTGMRSWRMYPAYFVDQEGKPIDYRLFGAKPFSVVLYADRAGSVQHLSAVYANKGDFGSKAGFGEEHFDAAPADTEGLDDAMQADFDTIAGRLTSALGDPATQRFGEGKERRTVSRWDFQGTSILLAMEDGEFVSLSIVPVAFAESGGKTTRVDDEAVRKRVAGSVKRSDNGDVVITGIPMVDQGPKGYCVPATFERAMRFMGIDADMYLLAMVGQSEAGGGTDPQLLLDEVKSQVYRKGRRTKDDETSRLSISRLKRYLDDGIPVMWVMCSLDDYNKVADANTEERKKVTDWTAWAEKIKEQSKEFSRRDPESDQYHICMIVGYNEKTGELAVSDSWGPQFELRWVPEGLAQWVHDGKFVMILP